RIERPCRGNDRVVVDVEPRGDVGQAVGHAGAAGDAVDQAFRLLQHLGDDAFGGAHLPQDVGMDAPLAAGKVPGPPRLRQRAPHRVGNQLLVPLPPRLAVIELRNRAPVLIEAIGIHRAEGADPAGKSPVAGRNAVGDGDALAALNQRQHVDAAHPDRVDCPHSRQTISGGSESCIGDTPASSRSKAAVRTMPPRLPRVTFVNTRRPDAYGRGSTVSWVASSASRDTIPRLSLNADWGRAVRRLVRKSRSSRPPPAM